jgi:SAM-dependent methyltransferase
VYRQRDEADAKRLLGLVLDHTRLETGSTILDMACGRGRHAKLLAEAGFQVTGVDLSERAIRDARDMARSAALDILFEVGDMRAYRCDEPFDMVVNLFTSFGYFDEDADDQKAVHVMAQALKRSGWLVQDFMNGAYWRAHFVPEDERQESGLRIRQRRWLENERLNKEIILDDEETGREHRFTESVRLYGVDDFERMYHQAGLRIDRLYGGADGRPLDDEAPRMIIFSRRD